MKIFKRFEVILKTLNSRNFNLLLDIIKLLWKIEFSDLLKLNKNLLNFRLIVVSKGKIKVLR